MDVITIQLEPVLNRAWEGMALANRVLHELQAHQQVCLDFDLVQRATPSFANAFVMTLLENLSLDEVRYRILMENRRPYVTAALSASAQRYIQGVRLSHQQPVPATAR